MRRKTTQKSARFPVEQCSSPYPGHYSPAFAFSAIPYPHSQRITLRLTCPKAAIRAYHVPCLSHDWVRVCLSTGGHTATYLYPLQRYPTTYLLVRACQQFGLVNRYGVYQQFTWVTHASQPSASTRYCSEHLRPASRRGRTREGAHCQKNFTPHRCQ